MRIKDNYGVYHDIELPLDIERQLYQNNQVTFGYFDITGKEKHNGYNFGHVHSRPEKEH